jgi:hypothetical protein
MSKAARPLIERTHSVDVRELHRQSPFSLDPKSFPFVGVTARRFKIEYRGRRWPRDRRSQTIAVTWTRCHFGGMRPWFICSCGKRVAVMYPGFLDLLFCRACVGLAYQSQLWGSRRRLLRKAEAIRRVLGDDYGRPAVDAAPKRPKGMHRKTYMRHRAMLERAEWRLREGGAYRPKTRRRFTSEIKSNSPARGRR